MLVHGLWLMEGEPFHAVEGVEMAGCGDGAGANCDTSGAKLISNSARVLG